MRKANDYDPKAFANTLDKIKSSPYPSGHLRAGTLSLGGAKATHEKLDKMIKRKSYSKDDYEL